MNKLIFLSLAVSTLFAMGIAQAEPQMFATSITIGNGDTTKIYYITSPGQVILVNVTSGQKVNMVIQGNANPGSQITTYTDLLNPTLTPYVGLEQLGLPATFEAYDNNVVLGTSGTIPENSNPTLLELTTNGGNILTVIGNQEPIADAIVHASNSVHQYVEQFRNQISSSSLPPSREQYYTILADQADTSAQNSVTETKSIIDTAALQLNAEELNYSKAAMLVSQAQHAISSSDLPPKLSDSVNQEEIMAKDSLNAGDYDGASNYAQDILAKVKNGEQDYIPANQELQKAEAAANATAMPDDDRKQSELYISCAKTYLENGDFKQSIDCSDNAINLTNIPLWQSIEIRFPWLYPIVVVSIAVTILFKMWSKRKLRQRPKYDFISP